MPYSWRELERILRELDDEVVDYSSLETVANLAGEDDDLYELQKNRGHSYTRRQVAEFEHGRDNRDLSELRAFAQDHPGRRDELWPLVHKSGTPYSQRELGRILRELHDEVVDSSSLEIVANVAGQDDDLYDLQKSRGHSYTRRQVAEYEH